MTEVTAPLEAPDGVVLNTRHWPAAEPWAAMLIVHGVSEHSGRWSHVGRFFADRGIDAHAFDLRGHGRSGGDRMWIDSFSDYADDVAFVAESEVLPLRLPWVLYGHSMGGLIVTGYLLSDRPQPDAAVLSAPGLDSEFPRHIVLAARVLGKVVPRLRIASSLQGEQLSRDPAVAAAYEEDPLVDTRTTTKLGYEGLFRAQPAARAGAADITVPTLVIHGTDDPIVPPRASAPLAASPPVERKLYPGLRHELHNEPEAEDILGDVYAFIRRILDQDHEA